MDDAVFGAWCAGTHDRLKRTWRGVAHLVPVDGPRSGQAAAAKPGRGLGYHPDARPAGCRGGLPPCGMQRATIGPGSRRSRHPKWRCASRWRAPAVTGVPVSAVCHPPRRTGTGLTGVPPANPLGEYVDDAVLGAWCAGADDRLKCPHGGVAQLAVRAAAWHGAQGVTSLALSSWGREIQHRLVRGHGPPAGRSCPRTGGAVRPEPPLRAASLPMAHRASSSPCGMYNVSDKVIHSGVRGAGKHRGTRLG